jgi:hypothetical protein
MNAVAGIGAPVRRREDLRLLTGNGHYSDDLTLPGQLRAVMLRSPHAHADIVGIDTTTAKLVPGVVAVFTADDLLADGVQPIPPDYVFMGAAANSRDFPDPVLLNRDGTEMFASPYLPIATFRRRRMVPRRSWSNTAPAPPSPGPRRRSNRRRRGYGTTRRPTSCSMPNSVTARRSMRCLPRRRMSWHSTPGSPGSPGCQWRRARRWACMIPAPGG